VTPTLTVGTQIARSTSSDLPGRRQPDDRSRCRTERPDEAPDSAWRRPVLVPSNRLFSADRLACLPTGAAAPVTSENRLLGHARRRRDLPNRPSRHCPVPRSTEEGYERREGQPAPGLGRSKTLSRLTREPNLLAGCRPGDLLAEPGASARRTRTHRRPEGAPPSTDLSGRLRGRNMRTQGAPRT
jgi:hypothetical protein